jgi:hypothetical protein
VPASAHVPHIRLHPSGPDPRLRRLSGRRFTRERSLVRNQPRPWLVKWLVALALRRKQGR